MEHGTTPDQGLVAGIQETYRDDLEVVGFERLYACVRKNPGLSADAKHQGHVGPVNVGVEQTDAVSQLGQNNREIDCERRLSHTAFAGTDRDNGGHAGQRLRCGGLLSGAGGKVRTHDWDYTSGDSWQWAVASGSGQLPVAVGSCQWQWAVASGSGQFPVLSSRFSVAIGRFSGSDCEVTS